MKRLTLNYGARFEHFNASVPAESSPASTWIGARDFPAIPNVPNWNDWAVRFAAAYDLFGDGKTALKANAGKYVASQAAGYAQTFNGMSGTTQTVTWTDAGQERHDPRRRRQHRGQRGRRPHVELRAGYRASGSRARARLQLGVQRPAAARAVAAHVGHRRLLSPRFLQPAGRRQPEPERERLDACSRSRRRPTRGCRSRGSRFRSTPSTRPRSARRPITCITYSTQNKSSYNGIEVSANVRRDKFILFGGVTTDRLVTSNCDGSTTLDVGARGASARDNPNSLRFCDVTLATSGQPAGVFRTTVKASAAYSFPYDVQLSGSFIVDSGSGRQRRLHGDLRDRGPAIIGIDDRHRVHHRESRRAELALPRLPEPSRHAPRQDVPRSTTRKIQGFVDIFNVLNAGTVMSVNQTYGAVAATNAWLTPTHHHGRAVRPVRAAAELLEPGLGTRDRGQRHGTGTQEPKTSRVFCLVSFVSSCS